MAEAEQSLPKLPDLIARHKEVAAAWQRGRFLRNLRGLASVAVTVDEAARRLELADPDELHHMIENDSEVRDTWRQTRQEAFIRIKLALVKTALEGNQAAIRAVENFLRAEVELKRLPDTYKLKVNDIAALTGRTRPTVYEWVNKGRLPIDTDKTIDLGSFIRWLSFIEDGRLRLQNRHLIDISDRYPELACLRELPAGTVIDGEIVVLEHGRPSFQKLQQRDHLSNPTRIEILSKRMPVTLMAFDLLYVRGRRITGQPLTERRQRLIDLVGRLSHPLAIAPDYIVGHGIEFFAGIVRHRLEDMMAKRIDSPYLIGKRSSDWLKVKVAQTAEFEVIGCVPMRGEKAIRVLLLGERDRGRLVYKGKVGSGLTRKQREDLLAELLKAPKLQELVGCPSESICRLPGWRCRVRYFGLTEMGHLRMPSFEGLV
jgi:predicted DNA-binding transcriptional regulator AlpA